MNQYTNIKKLKYKELNDKVTKEEYESIIDYAIEKNLYVILDMHHDDQTWLSIAGTNKEFNQVKKQFRTNKIEGLLDRLRKKEKE